MRWLNWCRDQSRGFVFALADYFEESTSRSFECCNLFLIMTNEPKSGASLYERLGGYDVIAAFVDDAYRLMRGDPTFSRFATRSVDSQQRSRQLLVDQICYLAGGPCLYIGRDMKTAHVGLRISREEWDRSVKHTRQALANQGVRQGDADEVIALIQQYCGDIVEEAA